MQLAKHRNQGPVHEHKHKLPAQLKFDTEINRSVYRRLLPLANTRLPGSRNTCSI